MTLLAQKTPLTETTTTLKKSPAAVPTRRGYLTEATEYKFVYLRRTHPAEPVELCLGRGHHDCAIIKLTADQLRDLARDAVSLHFTVSVKA